MGGPVHPQMPALERPTRKWELWREPRVTVFRVTLLATRPSIYRPSLSGFFHHIVCVYALCMHVACVNIDCVPVTQVSM